MKIKCGHCQARLNVNDRLGGQVRPCPECKLPIRIPAVTPQKGSSSKKTPSDYSVPEPAVPSGATSKPTKPTKPISTAKIPDLPSTADNVSDREINPWKQIQKAVFQAEVKSWLSHRWRWTIEVLLRFVHHLGEVGKFYRSRHEAIFIRAMFKPMSLGVRREALREAYLNDKERVSEHWQIDLPACCVRCGAHVAVESKLVVRHVDDMSWTVRVLKLTLFAVMIAWWTNGWWLSLAVGVIGLRLGYVKGVGHPVSLKISHCAVHHQDNRFPELFLAADGLLLRFGHQKTKDRFVADRRSEYSQQSRKPKARTSTVERKSSEFVERIEPLPKIASSATETEVSRPKSKHSKSRIEAKPSAQCIPKTIRQEGAVEQERTDGFVTPIPIVQARGFAPPNHRNDSLPTPGEVQSTEKTEPLPAPADSPVATIPSNTEMESRPGSDSRELPETAEAMADLSQRTVTTDIAVSVTTPISKALKSVPDVEVPIDVDRVHRDGLHPSESPTEAVPTIPRRVINEQTAGSVIAGARCR